ncbi:MAG: T9SS type A sorting domain-containing protein [Melioribacteraceae bacterium]
MKKFYKLVFIYIVILAEPSMNTIAQSGGEKSLSSNQNLIHNSKGGDKKISFIKGINGMPIITKFNINKISTWLYNTGESDMTPNDFPNLEYPKGSKKNAVFQSGFIWGAKIDSVIHVGGAKYEHSTSPGRVINGIPVNPADLDVRIYRVRRDYIKNNYNTELIDESKSIEEIRAEYEKNWVEWPATQGAPYEDLNTNGSYEPEIDIPGVPGADQTIWFVCNDFDSVQTKNMSGSLPLGFEEQVTIWGYDSNTPLGNMLFRKYIIINKNPEHKPYSDLYLSYWCDADIGDGFDDQIGSDSTMNLGFMYNGKGNDNVYGSSPPAVGVKLLQGPFVNGISSDTAKYKGKYLAGKKNLEMSSFFNENDNQSNIALDPDPFNYTYNTIGLYNMFQGKYRYGYPVINPITHEETKFMYSGDPITNNGWISNKDDQRMGVVSGPFNMAYGDTQEVVYALIFAGADGIIDRLEAFSLLKKYSAYAQNHYDKAFYILMPPIPQSPLNNGTDVATDPILNWTVIDGFVSYSLQVATDMDFRNMVVNESGLLKTNYELSGLINSTKYYWRVSVQDIHGSSYYSQVYSFTTKPNLLNPTLKIEPDYLEIDSKGGEITFQIKNTSIGTLNWEAVSNDTSWIKIIGESKGSDSAKIKVLIAENIKMERVGTITISAEGAAGSPRIIEIKQETAIYNIDITINPDTTAGFVRGNKKFYYDDTALLIATPKNGYTFLNWSENDSVITTDSIYQFIVNKNRNLVVNFSGPFSLITRIAEMEGSVMKDARVGIDPAGASLGPNGYILSNQAGGVNLPYASTDYDRFDYWKNDDLIIDFSEKSLAYSYLDEFIYKNIGSGEVTYLPFSVYRLKYPTMEKIRLFAGFRDKNADGLFSIDSTGAYDINWHKPTTELIFAWQGYDAAGNEINYDPANKAQYIAENDLYKSANIKWGSSTGEFKYPFLTNTMFVLYTANATLPDSNRQIRFFTAKPIVSDVNEGEQYENQNQIPVQYSLSQNYPNPFNPTTNIRFSLTKLSFTSLKIYDILGREVATLVNGELSAGRHTYEFDGSRLSSGIYFYRLQTGEFTQTKKMLLIK